MARRLPDGGIEIYGDEGEWTVRVLVPLEPTVGRFFLRDGCSAYHSPY